MTFERAFSGNPWEKSFGYCRAVRAGDTIYVSGTAARGEQGEVVAAGDMYAQSVRCLEIISNALEKLGGDLSRVVRLVLEQVVDNPLGRGDVVVEPVLAAEPVERQRVHVVEQDAPRRREAFGLLRERLAGDLEEPLLVVVGKERSGILRAYGFLASTRAAVFARAFRCHLRGRSCVDWRITLRRA